MIYYIWIWNKSMNIFIMNLYICMNCCYLLFLIFLTRWHADTLKNKESFGESVLQIFHFWACHACQSAIFNHYQRNQNKFIHVHERLLYGSSWFYSIKWRLIRQPFLFTSFFLEFIRTSYKSVSCFLYFMFWNNDL